MKTIDKEKQRLIYANLLFIKFKWLYYTALVLTGVMSKVTGEVQSNSNFSPFTMLSIGAVVYGYNFCFYLYFKRRSRVRPFKEIKYISYINLIVDFIALSLVVFFAGGLTSIGFLYFFYPIAASGFFFSLFETAFVSSLAAFFYGGLILLQYFDIIPYISRYKMDYEIFQAHNPSAVFPNLWAVLTSFFIVGAFVGLLAKNLRQKEKDAVLEREKVEAIITNMVDGLVYIDAKGVISMVNPQAERLLGLNADEIMHQYADGLDFAKWPALKKLFDNTGPTSREITLRGRPDIAYKISSFAIKDDEDKLIGKAKIIRDVSREKFVSEMKSEFITIAGHQLRTPLSAIKGGLDLLRKGEYGKISEEQEKILDQSFEYTERLIRIVNDLLNVSSIEEGRYDYRFEKTDIHDLLREVSERFSNDAEKKNIDFSMEILSNLSEVELDPYKIKLALGGIINNAVTYTEEGGKVAIKCDFEDAKIQISVKDSGIGIPRQEQDKVFTKFFRAKNAMKHITEGNGLDLFVAKNIISNHHGRIWFESEIGEGSTFFVELPITQPKTDEIKAA